MANRDKKKKKGSAGFNRKTGEDFLSKNKKKEGVIETDSGLQYIILDKGTDTSHPVEESLITVHQRCQLVNGNIIEDTYHENKPSEVKMEELIEGYREGIMLMTKGAKFRFFVPPELAWGKKGSGSKIPPNAVLIFDVRLIDF